MNIKTQTKGPAAAVTDAFKNNKRDKRAGIYLPSFTLPKLFAF